MRAIWILLVALPAFFVPPAGAEGPPARKPRPPPDYSGRVQLHELPAAVAPPEMPDVKEDARKIDSRAAPQLRPEPSPLSLVPPPAPHGPDAPLPSLRELINESARRPDVRSGTTGWGWLADDIATNRARRAEREARQRAREETDNESDFLTDESERDARLTRDAEQRQDLREADRDPAVSMRGGPRAIHSPWLEISPIAEELWPDGTARRFEGPLDWLPDRRPTESPSGFTLNGADFGRRLPSDDRAREERDMVERGVAARPVIEGIRALREENIWPIERPGESGAQAGWGPVGAALDFTPVWSAPSFQPMPVGPSDVSLTPAPVATPPVGVLNAAPAAPAMGGIGAERERAAPRTLPW
jgi:hypothetical protein